LAPFQIRPIITTFTERRRVMTAVYHYHHEESIMDDDWGLVKNDCLLFSPGLNEDPLMGCHADSILNLSSDRIKMEPDDKDSDYQTSSSNSPSSLCDSVGVCDYSPLLLSSFPSCHQNGGALLHSPSSSNCTHPLSLGLSGVDVVSSSLGGMAPLASPLPPVSHFSHHSHQQHYGMPLGAAAAAASPTMMDHGYGMRGEQEEMKVMCAAAATGGGRGAAATKDDPSCLLDPLSSGPSSPLSPSMTSPGNNTMDPLYHHRLQIRTRSKMHEMALHHRLITEQDPRGSGHVQLSAEEKRTLIQEGYTVPSRLPLSKGEEEALRVVRRKIKNKLSAQESRRKRKEYIDTLEQRCQVYATENSHLKQRLKQLEAQVRKAGRV
ncbi:hypothetical protein PFISCL1PPCAC_8135, partial [Pristionchus fissidentatus]